MDKPKRYYGNLQSHPEVVQAAVERGYTPKDFYCGTDQMYYLFLDELGDPLSAGNIHALRRMALELPVHDGKPVEQEPQFEPGRICEYESTSRCGTVDVVFLEFNVAPDGWPIKTAMVQFVDGAKRKDSARVDQLRPTDRMELVGR